MTYRQPLILVFLLLLSIPGWSPPQKMQGRLGGGPAGLAGACSCFRFRQQTGLLFAPPGSPLSREGHSPARPGKAIVVLSGAVQIRRTSKHHILFPIKTPTGAV